MFFGIRFDFRNPPLAATSMADRYAAALDMVEWADDLGCVNVTVSEHHGSADGYLPSPIPMLAAMAARTRNTRFMIGALIAPFHDPLRLAEDLIFLDNLSRGRVDVVLAGGYVREEFAMFDVPMNERGARVAEAVNTLKAAFTGDEFRFRGRPVRLTPPPTRPGGPSVLLGGSSEAAARRAARIADGFIPSLPEFWEFYRDERVRLGHPDPGPTQQRDNTTVFLAEDPERAWHEMAPFFMHEMNAYGAWQAQDGVATQYRTITDTDALRDTGQYRVITPEQMVHELKALPVPFHMFHPMCGGMPVELAWSSMRLFSDRVLPALG